jgi:hypothetical protein
MGWRARSEAQSPINHRYPRARRKISRAPAPRPNSAPRHRGRTRRAAGCAAHGVRAAAGGCGRRRRGGAAAPRGARAARRAAARRQRSAAAARARGARRGVADGVSAEPAGAGAAREVGGPPWAGGSGGAATLPRALRTAGAAAAASGANAARAPSPSLSPRHLPTPPRRRPAPPRSSAPPPWPLRILRSTQLDALRLDAELVTMLREQFARVFAFFQPVRQGEEGSQKRRPARAGSRWRAPRGPDACPLLRTPAPTPRAPPPAAPPPPLARAASPPLSRSSTRCCRSW